MIPLLLMNSGNCYIIPSGALEEPKSDKATRLIVSLRLVWTEPEEFHTRNTKAEWWNVHFDFTATEKLQKYLTSLLYIINSGIVELFCYYW